MNEATALKDLFQSLNMNDWWIDLLGQRPNYDNTFDMYKAMDRIPRTEIKTAEEIKRKFGNTISYNSADNKWYLWDGKVHAPCEGDAVAVKIAKEYYYAIDRALAFIKDKISKEAQAARVAGGDKPEERAAAILATYEKGEWRKFRDFRDSIAKSAGQASLVKSLQTEVDISANHFEEDRRFFVVRNGVIDLAKYRMSGKVELEPHSATRPVYRYFDADYDVNITENDYPIFRGFLASSIVDWETACLLQKAVGAAFSAPAKPRAMINLLGAPASGKSMFLTIFEHLGQGYTAMPNNQAIQVFGNDTNPYQDEMYGARFMGFSEVQGTKALNDGFIKQIMGGDLTTTRRLYGQPRKWYPQGLMFVASNMPLKIDFRDDATMNKIFPITFPHTFSLEDPEHKIDEQLQAKILGDVDGSGATIYEGERSGLLHWVLKGMSLYWKEGLTETASVLAARDATKTNSSYSIKFVSELLGTGLLVEDLSLNKSDFVLKGDVYKAFKFWCEEQNVKNVPGKQTFNADIEKFYHGEANSGGKRFNGIASTPEWQVLVNNDSIIMLANAMKNLDERDKVTGR